jgi:flagellar export protein FliJ
VRVRLLRAQRLLGVEVKRVAAAEVELAASRGRREQVAAVLRAIEEALTGAYTRWLDVVSVDELAQASAHRCALEARVAVARTALAKADAELREREAGLVAARTAERRMEILIEGFERAVAAREGKAERRLADEHASRMSGPTR